MGGGGGGWRDGMILNFRFYTIYWEIKEGGRGGFILLYSWFQLEACIYNI